MAKYQGSGAIATTDYKAVKWVGVTKDGKAVTITLAKAINMNNIDLTFADKSETVAQLVYTAVYSNTNAPASSTDEPWTIELGGQSSGASEIILGAGMFYIDSNVIGLTKGGGQFTVERTFREIAADGDRGAVEGRIVMDESRATLTVNALSFLTKFDDIYPAINIVSDAE